MHRREALRNVALLVGGGVVLSGTTMSMLFDSCTTPNKNAAALFTAKQVKLLTALADVVIPTTPSCPGAKAANIGPFIATMLKDCYPQETQKEFTEGLKAFEVTVETQLKKTFLEASTKEREDMVASLRMKTIAQQKADKEQKSNSPQDKNKNPEYKGNYVKTAARSTEIKKSYFFVLVRDLTILGYFSSKIGATQARAYIAVPGHYDGCVDLQPGQKAWA